ncbi:MAG: hypothetical protein NTX14_02065 [Candidatus Nealsonbacteria bacterium]|nr:hypothetical protein [Candidatus Nealsonbacteria bacterium]
MGKILPTGSLVFFLLGHAKEEYGTDAIISILTPYRTYKEFVDKRKGHSLWLTDVKNACKKEILKQHPRLKYFLTSRVFKKALEKTINLEQLASVIDECLMDEGIPTAVVLEEPKSRRKK